MIIVKPEKDMTKSKFIFTSNNLEMKSISNLFYFLLFLVIILFNISCKTDEPSNASTVKDTEGNVYHTVTIASQTWMVENLKVTKYNDGTPIPNISDNITWSNLTTGAYCDYNNDVVNGEKYGHLYNWYAVNTGKLAPKGWHVATEAEWYTLLSYVSDKLGSSSSISSALAATTDWAKNTTMGAIGNDLTKNNSTGFTALPGGSRSEDGTFMDDIRLNALWWCSTEYDSRAGWEINMEYDGYLVFAWGLLKECGGSVRCIKDY
jgi:uncharacterized protein (TIGR02145 family)